MVQMKGVAGAFSEIKASELYIPHGSDESNK